MIGIIDYKAGNAPSVLSAVSHLGYGAELVREPGQLEGKTHIILPGVGSAGATMLSLKELGFIEPLTQRVLTEGTLFLGVCVGMQILFDHSEEEAADCLGFIPGQVVRFDAKTVRVPQMGWNEVKFVKGPACQGKDGYFYFVNSYYAVPEHDGDQWGIANYGHPFTAAVCRGNIYGTQFHIEKSGEAGLALLDGFLKLEGKGILC